jgi:glucose-6-phosphate 1-dehydrogenase
MAGTVGTLFILGAGGDLTSRLLLPGLGHLLASERGTSFQLIGVDSRPMDDAEWRHIVSTAFGSHAATAKRVRSVAQSSVHRAADVTDPGQLQKLLDESEGTPAIYFALPPHVTIAACSALENVTLPEGTLLCLEKPFGTDLESATALNRQLARLVPENQVHRIDHFLGKSTVLNLLGLRFANRIFERVWNAENVASVDIIFDESLALEGRAGYYDKAGALVDMIQSHLLLVLALIAMEAPSSLDADDLRGAVAQALRATAFTRGDPAKHSRRARYVAGEIDGRRLPAYSREEGVKESNKTETLAEVEFRVNNWRWAGVPFRLRSGKALGEKSQQIILTFRDVPHRPIGLEGDPGPSQLRISLNPDQLSLDVNLNGQGNPFQVDRAVLDAEFGPGELPAYGEVLAGILAGDPTLSVRGDAIEELWRIVAPVLAAWGADKVPLETYPAGTAGPTNWNN